MLKSTKDSHLEIDKSEEAYVKSVPPFLVGEISSRTKLMDCSNFSFEEGPEPCIQTLKQ